MYVKNENNKAHWNFIFFVSEKIFFTDKEIQ